jgi:hypothetical protein
MDEYDVPIQSGYLYNYYDEVIEFTRNFLSGGSKDNENIYKVVLTGILRIAKESIFSGLNNLSVCTILNNKYSSYFGFTEKDAENVWSFLFFSGYLKAVKKERVEKGRLRCHLAIPNIKVNALYEDIILNWFKVNVGMDKYKNMLNEKYEAEMKDKGIDKIVKLGIAFKGKELLVLEGVK